MACNTCDGCNIEGEALDLVCENKVEDAIIELKEKVNSLTIKEDNIKHLISDLLQQLTINSHMSYSYLINSVNNINEEEDLKKFKQFLLLCIEKDLLFLDKEPKHCFLWALQYVQFNIEKLTNILNYQDEMLFLNLKTYCDEQKTWYEMVNMVNLKHHLI